MFHLKMPCAARKSIFFVKHLDKRHAFVAQQQSFLENTHMSFLSAKSQQNASRKEVEYSLEEYLNLCKTDRMAYASAAERLLAAIGEPAVIDTSKEPRLARIFQNRTIRTYTPFSDFYGIEDTIERLVNFIRSAAQGTGESRKILHMLGPVGSAKSTLAERLKALMETYPIYVLCANGVASPVFESPLGLFDPETDAAALQEEYGIPLSAIKIVPSPWALVKMFDEEDAFARGARHFEMKHRIRAECAGSGSD